MNQYDELYHYGVKGMRWGVRRFQKKDGTLTPAGKKRYDDESVNREFHKESSVKIRKNKDGSETIPRGYVFNRVGGASLDVNDSGGLYVSSGKADAARYVKNLGPSLMGKLLKTAHYNVQHISVKGDIKKASMEQTSKETAKLLLNNPKLTKEFNDSIYSLTAGNGFEPITTDMIKKAYENPSSKEAIKIAYSLNSFLGDPYYKNESKTVYEHFRKLGFDAIPDLHDTLSGTSETATIIINPSKVEVKSVTKITKEVYKEGKNYVKSLEKLKINDLIK